MVRSREGEPTLKGWFGEAPVDAVLILARMLAGGFFVWSGSSKLGHSRKFWSQIMDYRITGARTSRILAATLPPLEFLGGLFFAAGVHPRGVGYFLLLMLT